MSTWAKSVNSIVLFLEDLPAAIEFYPASSRCRWSGFSMTVTPVRSETRRSSWLSLARAASSWRPRRSRRATLLREPEDRPEGYRGATFADWGGHLYEISSGFANE